MRRYNVSAYVFLQKVNCLPLNTLVFVFLNIRIELIVCLVFSLQKYDTQFSQNKVNTIQAYKYLLAGLPPGQLAWVHKWVFCLAGGDLLHR